MSKEEMEKRYGPFGSGGRVIFLGGEPRSISGIMRMLDLQREEVAPVDCGTIGEETHFVRFIDLDDRTIAVLEFDSSFKISRELRSDLLHWMGDDYFRARWRVFCPGGGEEWLGRDGTKYEK